MKRLLRIFFFLFFLGIIALLLLELSFRYQIIDFYFSELRQLNELQDEKYQAKRVLIIGDSFSTFPDGYVSQLNDANPDISVINGAVSGTGILQHRLFLSDRVDEFEPQRLIYQLYLGNDFLDIHPPINFKQLPWYRNVYWWLSKHILVLQYLNFRMAVFKGDQSATFKRLQEDEFNSGHYNKRVKIQFKGNPSYLENTLYLEDEGLIAYSNWKKEFQASLDDLPVELAVSLLIIPHCAQVDSSYLISMQSLGASFERNISATDLPIYYQIQNDFPLLEVINPLDRFQEVEKSGESLYFGNDPHLNARGQQILFEYLQTNFYDAN